MPSKDLNCLKPDFKKAVETLLEAGKGIPGLRVVETCRTLAEQKEKIRLGFSQTLKSKHLTGDAVDIYVKDYSPKLYGRLYDIARGIKHIIYPHYDRGWATSGFIDRLHFEYDSNKLKPFEEEYMTKEFTHELVIETIRHARRSLFGHSDEFGGEAGEADADRVEKVIEQGSPYELGNVIDDYIGSAEFQERWIETKNCNNQLLALDNEYIKRVENVRREEREICQQQRKVDKTKPAPTQGRGSSWLQRLLSKIKEQLKE